MPEHVRRDFERSLNYDLGGVRLHTGSDAAQAARAVDARAFTHGRDIYFGDGEYDPASGAGLRLLAHELAHIVQQDAGNTAGELRRVAGDRTFQSKRLFGSKKLVQVHDGKRNVKHKDTGRHVFLVQLALITLGYRAPSSGVFDETTQAVVKAFQRTHDLKASGVMGKKTLDALDTALVVHDGVDEPPRDAGTAPSRPGEGRGGRNLGLEGSAGELDKSEDARLARIRLGPEGGTTDYPQFMVQYRAVKANMTSTTTVTAGSQSLSA